MKNIELTLKSIIEVLLVTPHFLTLKSLADTVGISRRSVQNYLDKLEIWISDNKLEKTTLYKKQGVGILLKTEDGDREKIEKLIGFSRLNIFSGDYKRRLEVIKKLLFSDDELTIKLISDEYFVSRSVILSDLEWAEQWFAQFNLKLFKTQHRGIGLTGSEICRRNAIAGFFDIYENASVSTTLPVIAPHRLREKCLRNLLDVYSEESVRKVERIINEAEREFDFYLVDDYYSSLLTHLVICITRVLAGNPVPEEFLPPDESYPELETKTAKYIAKRLNVVFNVNVDVSEIDYICIHLVGYNAFSADWFAPPKIEWLAINLIERMSEMLNVDLRGDDLLLSGLCFHLKTSVYRLQNNVYYKSTLPRLLPESSKNILECVKRTTDSYAQISLVKPDEEELLSIAYYFLLAIYRKEREKKAILVCNQGIAASLELFELVRNTLPHLKIVEWCSGAQLPLLSGLDYEYIITTQHLKTDKILIDLSSCVKADYAKKLLSEV